MDPRKIGELSQMSERTKLWLTVAERLLAVLGALVTGLLAANQVQGPGRDILPGLSEQLLVDPARPAAPGVRRSVSCWSNPVEWPPMVVHFPQTSLQQ